MNSNLLVEAVRNNLPEKYFTGWVIVVNDKQKLINKLDNNDFCCYMRSCAKPFQLLNALETGVNDKYKLDSCDITLGFASHSGSADHIKHMKELLKKLNIKEQDLLCGTHPPIDTLERNRLIKEEIQPGVLHHNCSGKHTFMIASCLILGVDISTYKNPENPIQQSITKLIKEYCNPKEHYMAIDGCEVPVHGMKLTEMGAGFAKLFKGETNYTKLIADSVKRNPLLAAGNGRIDTAIIKDTNGKLISKVGAEGLIMVSPCGIGETLVVKISSGDNYIRDLVTIEALKQLKWLESDPTETELLSQFTKTSIFTTTKVKSGEYKFKFKL